MKSSLIEAAIDPASVRPDPNNPNWTIPRSWGVYEVANYAASQFRFGNHPVRERELRREFSRVTLLALYEERELAKARARAENDR